MSRLILVRHGETLWNREHRLQGTSDQALSDCGHDQAERLAAALPGPVAKIYVSPLLRTHQFAAPLAARFNLVPEVLEELREMSFGHLEGLTYAEMDDDRRQIFESWLHNPVRYSMPGGETMRVLSRRVGRAVQKMTDGSMEKGTPVVAVSHGGVIRVAVARLLGMKLTVIPRVQVETGSITVLEKAGSVWRLLLLNDTCHLR